MATTRKQAPRPFRTGTRSSGTAQEAEFLAETRFLPALDLVPAFALHPKRTGRLLAVLLLALLAGALVGCTDVRPTIKIGVLAPFEGLHRRSGYAALDAVRAAIDDFPYAAAGILPLALDDGARPAQAARSAEKMLVDPRVRAVVGPLTPELGAAIVPVSASTPISWFTPYSMAGQDWAEGLVHAAAELGRQQGAQGLVLAGWTEGWPRLDARQWAEIAGMPARLDDDPAAVGDNEAVFWMGTAEGGATYLAELRLRERALSRPAIFVLGPQGEDPVFVERVLAAQTGFDKVYWTTWTDNGYTEWTANHSNKSPSAYTVYRAALAALQTATAHHQSAPSPSWFVQSYQYDDQGVWTSTN